jgi:anti-sigma-K factor RskA
MNYQDPDLRRQLAGAYALGTLRGAARRRFERLMLDDAALQRLVVEYQEDLVPLALHAPSVQPPARIRARLEQATAPRTATRDRPGIWHRLGFWRGLATANATLAVALVAVIGVGVLQPEPVPPELVYVGVLSDRDDQPAVAVLAYNRPFRLDISAKTPLTPTPGREYRLWFKRGDGSDAVFLSAIPSGQTSFALDDESWRSLREARTLLITREHAAAATTAPGDDVLYEGVCVNLKRWAEPAPAN